MNALITSSGRAEGHASILHAVTVSCIRTIEAVSAPSIPSYSCVALKGLK